MAQRSSCGKPLRRRYVKPEITRATAKRYFAFSHPAISVLKCYCFQDPDQRLTTVTRQAQVVDALIA